MVAEDQPEPSSLEFRDQFRIAEYASLRNEILQGRQFVFERPLIVIFAAAVAVAQLAGKDLLIAVPPALAAILLFNLAFTVNRLRSVARISAYMDAVLEPYAEANWIGWERALRTYRTWFAQTPEHVRREAIENNIDRNAIPDAMIFYPHLLALHVVPLLAAIAGSALLVAESSSSFGMRLFGLAATGIITGAGIWLGYYRLGLHPDKLRTVIEEERTTWLLVFGRAPHPLPEASPASEDSQEANGV